MTTFDWLVDGAPGATTSPEVLDQLCRGLEREGVRLTRAMVFVRTLHPQSMGRWFVWRPNAPSVDHGELRYESQREFFSNSPFETLQATGKEVRYLLDRPMGVGVLDRIRGEGGTEYLALPLPFLDGTMHGISFATDRAGGFTEVEREALRRVARPLARLAEIFAQRRTATNLLDAYVGHGAGERILRGQVRRGDVQRVRCAIWFSDLRGYTALSGQRTPEEIIAILNRVFDCQVPAVVERGGEVLKFIGDGMLAIFPVGEAGEVGAVCEAAVGAARAAQQALDTLNAASGEPALGIGIGLHLGEVAYGNIGGAARIDFTCIGPAVNLAARVEGLTSKLGKAILVTDDFARACPTATRPLGAHALKGVAEPTGIHEPV